MKKIIYIYCGLMLSLNALAQEKPITAESFAIINLDYKGMENVKKLVDAKDYDKGAKALLEYYRSRADINIPNNYAGKSIGVADQLKADNALLHKFQPHKGYGFFDYGKDINWQMWPVKDNEVRWQLHRVYWWDSMGRAYRSSGNEEYAKEWVLQVRDWANKNPLGLSEDNDRYAWRALEISERLSSLPGTFTLFVQSPNFTPNFLMEFLKIFYLHANALPKRYASEGNHRLFEAQRELTAGTFFHEYKDAEIWRQSGVEILNTEIKKQVYPDGMHFELAAGYHNAMIDTFLKGLRSAQEAGLENIFPESYKQTIEKMVLATANFSFPDYTFPMFGDAWLVEKNTMVRQFVNWAKAFPNNKVIEHFATDGAKGELPAYLSKGLTDAGFYTFRSGWDMESTVMVLKASPPGEFHAQPDNGTFELWVKGRDFTPDAGVYVYSGDDAINKLREEYRQTKMHNTLTLNDQNMVITKANAEKWTTDKAMDVLTYTNPSYADLNHQRSVLYIDQKYFLIIDNAIGNATGKLDVRFHLKEDAKPVYELEKKLAYTTYGDGNNLLIQSLNTDKVNLLKEQSKVSYAYRKELPRPVLAFEKQKTNNKTQSFISIVYPFSRATIPRISIRENSGNDYASGKVNVTLTIEGKAKNVMLDLVK